MLFTLLVPMYCYMFTNGLDRQFPVVRHCNDTAWKIFVRNVVIITVVKDKRMNTSFVMTMVKVMIV